MVLLAILVSQMLSLLQLAISGHLVSHWPLAIIILSGSFGACLALQNYRTKAEKSANTHAERQLAYLADFATDLFWETDRDGRIIAASGRLLPTLTPNPVDMLGQHYRDVMQLNDKEMKKMAQAIRTLSPYSDIESTFHDPAGNSYHISLSAAPNFGPDGTVQGYLGVGTNITERVRHQRKLRHLAEHDILTGLANRYAFSNRICTDLATLGKGECLALLAIDLDGFKRINDTYGHQAGDALLSLFAKRLQTKTRDSDWAARLGGDEFVIISRHLSNPMEACLVAARLAEVLSSPYRIGGLELQVKASIGIACAPMHAKGVEALMKRADKALYQAKADGRGCYRLFEADTPARQA